MVSCRYNPSTLRDHVLCFSVHHSCKVWLFDLIYRSLPVIWNPTASIFRPLSSRGCFHPQKDDSLFALSPFGSVCRAMSCLSCHVYLYAPMYKHERYPVTSVHAMDNQIIGLKCHLGVFTGYLLSRLQL